MTLIITDHAEKRIRARYGIGRKSCHRMAQRAFDNGVTVDAVNGSLQRYLSYIGTKEDVVTQPRIFGNHVWVFEGITLITIFKVPARFRK